MAQEKEFDRSICFTFYKEFHEQIMDVKRDFGLEEAFKVYEAIANYGLHGTEIEKGRTRTLVGNATITKVENSQENRAKWFKGENFEQTKLVAEYMRDHPDASQRVIATATGVGKTKVGKVQKNIRESGFENVQEYLDSIVYPNLNDNNNNDNNNNSNNNIVTEGETDHRGQSEPSNSHTESATPPIDEDKSSSSASDEANQSIPVDLHIYKDITEQDVRDLEFNSTSHSDMFDDYEYVEKIYKKYIECCRLRQNIKQVISTVKSFMSQYHCDEDAIESCIGYFLYQHRGLRKDIKEIRINFEHSKAS